MSVLHHTKENHRPVWVPTHLVFSRVSVWDVRCMSAWGVGCVSAWGVYLSNLWFRRLDHYLDLPGLPWRHDVSHLLC